MPRSPAPSRNRLRRPSAALASLALAALAGCADPQPLQAGFTVSGGAGPIDEIRVTGTQGELTVSGEASIGVSGGF